MRAVLDPNVLIAAVLSASGAPAAILAAWLDGAFELVVSEELLTELERALAYPKLRRRIDEPSAAAYVTLLRRQATVAADPGAGTNRSTDPKDDYLLALAENQQAILVSGDSHLLELPGLPIEAPRAFLGRFQP